MQYRREIDGLRAVAVLPVILFHAGFDTFSGGYVGVDVFFVISGYLITSIILNDLQRGTFSVTGFYERRARRILPALFVVMTACIPFAFMWMAPSQLEDFGESLGTVVLFVSNIFFWSEDGYFAAAAELKPLLHTWSLAVEEQYYIVFPLFLMAVWRFSKKRIFWMIVVLAALSLLLAEYSVRHAPSAGFYLAPQRAWELLSGSVCAFLAADRTQKPSEVFAALGLGLILFSVFHFDEDTSFPGLSALFPVVGTAMIILFATGRTVVGRLLAMPALVAIGLISYSAYLWHQPLFAFARLRSFSEPGNVLMTGLAIASLLLAWATWRFVEQPFRRRPSPLLASRRRVFLASGTVGAALFATGLTLDVGEGLEWRLDEQALSLYASAASSPMRDKCHFEPDSTFSAEDSCVYFGNSPDIAVYGNSHGVELAYGLAKELEDTGRSLIHFTVSGCSPGFERKVSAYCDDFYRSRLDYLLGQTEITAVVLAFRIDEQDETAVTAVVDLANYLTAEGKTVIVLLQAPVLPTDITIFIRKAFNTGRMDMPSRARDDWTGENTNIYNHIVKLDQEVAVVDLADAFCDAKTCYAILDGSALYFDDDHMSLYGASLATPAILQHLRQFE